MYQYEIQTDFSEDEADLVAGRSTVRTANLDGEFSNLKLSLDDIISALTGIIRDDGALLDGVVTIPSLASDVLALVSSSAFRVIGPWVTATTYAKGDVISRPTGTYLCVIAHTAGVFATDLAAGDWTPLFDSSVLSASAITFTPVGTIAAANVQAAIAEAANEALQKASNLSDLTNLATARTNLNVLSRAELQAASALFAINSGTSDALIGAYTPTIAVLVDGMTLIIQATGANTVTAPTFNAGPSTNTIKRAGGLAMRAGDIPAAGSRAILSYHATGAYWELLNPQGEAILSTRQSVALKMALNQLTPLTP